MAMTPTATVQSLSEEEAARLTRGANSPDAVGDSGEAGTASLSADELFHLLQNARRRAVIRYLREREEPVEMREVAEQVAAWEHDTTVAQLDSKERQRVYISLYQSHLETLEDAGVIAYDKSRGVIEPQALLDEVASYLDGDLAAPPEGGDAEAEMPEVGRRHAVGVMLFMVGVPLGLAGLGLLSWGVVGGGLLGLFLGMAVTKLLLDSTETS